MSRFTPALRGRVSRREIALSPHVWFAVALAFAVFAVGCGFTGLFVHPFTTTRMLVLSGGLAAIAVGIALRPPPEPDSITTHVVIALAYGGTSAAMFAFAPYGTAALPAAAFIGPLIAIWLDDHRQMAAHYVAATVALLLPSLLGEANTATFVATCSLLPPTFVLGFCCLLVLRSAEAQGDRLEAMAMRDPLTGAGNRRLLHEHLPLELKRHHSSHRSLSVIALDLNGFKHVNDSLGHAAGDQLLITVAATIARTAGPRMTVVRQGGDEFAIIAPDTDEVGAVQLKTALREALEPIVSTGIGFATFPSDGGDRYRLLELADARLIAAKEHARQRAELATLPSLSDVVAGAPDGPAIDPATRAAALGAGAPAGASDGTVLPQSDDLDANLISRRSLATNVLIWRVTGAMFLFYSLVAVATMVWAPDLSGPWFSRLVAGGALVGLAVVLTRPAAIGTWRSHVVIAATYVVPALAVLACQPNGSVSIGAAVFIGPLVATRSETRRQAGVHILLATILLGAVAASGILFGLVDAPSILALLIQSLTMIILAFCCVVVFEAAEAQGRELERLAVRDPLTGLANRRRLHAVLGELLTQIDEEIDPEPVSVLALDLNGFKALNDHVGHAAGDELLVDVADQLRRVIGDQGLIARPGGDEFTVVLPGLDAAGAERLAGTVRERAGKIWRHGHEISTGVGVATAPYDARTTNGLLDLADRRLLTDKYGDDAPPAAVAPIEAEVAAPAQASTPIGPETDPSLRAAA
ncbi:MAG: diguanylate cyclase [Patulibacter sp.]|nr:diguanylate cyclase [Patulibacter sp.]